MGKLRGRLDPGEVKRAIADEERAATPTAPFHSPFAAARAQLEKVLPPASKSTGKASLSERMAQRAVQRPKEPSELARVRAEHRAHRAALAEAIQPQRRERARRGDSATGTPGRGDGGGGGGGDDER